MFQKEVVSAEAFEQVIRHFELLRKAAYYDWGHNGDSGTWCEKDDIKLIEGGWTYEKAHEYGMNENNYEDPAWAFQIGPSKWMIVGWCRD
jgi:hypothetical protein